MEVVCGSYDSVVIGCKVQKSVNDEYEFELSLTSASHSKSVKTVAISTNGFLATGSADEKIILSNLRAHKDLGELQHQQGIIYSIKFFSRTHMFSCCEDGSIAIWQVGTWELLRMLKGHTDAVYDIAVHPSGKMALSVSKDKTLRTWNLLTGKCAYVKNLKIAGDNVVWLPDEKRYGIVYDKMMDIYSIETGSVEHTIKHTVRINCVTFLKDNLMLASGEQGDIYFYSLKDFSKEYEFATNTERVKSMHCVECPVECRADDENATWLVTASRSGKLSLWTLTNNQGSWSHKETCSIELGCQLTAMDVFVNKAGPINNKAVKVKEKATAKRRKVIVEEETDDLENPSKRPRVEESDSNDEEEFLQFKETEKSDDDDEAAAQSSKDDDAAAAGNIKEDNSAQQQEEGTSDSAAGSDDDDHEDTFGYNILKNIEPMDSIDESEEDDYESQQLQGKASGSKKSLTKKGSAKSLSSVGSKKSNGKPSKESSAQPQTTAEDTQKEKPKKKRNKKNQKNSQAEEIKSTNNKPLKQTDGNAKGNSAKQKKKQKKNKNKA